jgi:hypothetical protein
VCVCRALVRDRQPGTLLRMSRQPHPGPFAGPAASPHGPEGAAHAPPSGPPFVTIPDEPRAGRRPGQRLIITYPNGRRIDIIAADATGGGGGGVLDAPSSTVTISREEAGKPRVILTRYEFGDFADFAGASEARRALAAYAKGDRDGAVTIAGLAAERSDAWRALPRALAGLAPDPGGVA